MDYTDLHLHTTCSDGSLTPGKLIDFTAKYGFKAIGITDHDTVDAIEDAIDAGKKIGIEIIPGIEFSTEIEEKEVHLLAYFIDWKNSQLLEQLAKTKRERVERLRRMATTLTSLGLTVDCDELLQFCGNGTAGRLHLASFLYKKNLVSSIYDAFKHYIGKGKPVYEPVNSLSLKDAIALLKNAGGIPVYAHPGINDMDEMIPLMINYGLLGIEVYHPSHSRRETKRYYSLAKKNNLLITGGSDWHGSAKPNVALGTIKLPYSYVEELKKVLE